MRVPLALLVALVGGVLVGEQMGGGPARTLLAASILGAALALWKRETRSAVLVVFLAAGLLGVAVEQRALHGLDISPLTRAVNTHVTAEAVLTLTEDPDGPMYQSAAMARIETFEGRSAGDRSVYAIASGDTLSAFGALDAGDRLRVRATVAPLHGYETRMRWRHAVGELRIEEIVAIARPDNIWYAAANVGRRSVLRGSAVLPSTPRGLLSGFLLGDTRAIPDDLVVAFRDAGLSHLLAVSGANVAFALAVVEPALRRLPRGSRLGAGLGVLVLFGTMTRWEPSVLRASVMAGLVMLARLMGRPADARRVLVLAMFGLLAADPFLLHSIGFLLSCGACAGIVIGSQPIAARLPGPMWFRDALGVTTAAQIGVAPILVATFGTLPLIALPANLLAAPFVGPLTVWGLVASLAGGVLGPGPCWWLELPTLSMLRAVEFLARSAATVPLAIDGRGAVIVGLGCAAMVFVTGGRPRLAGRLASHGRRVHREGQRPDSARS